MRKVFLMPILLIFSIWLVMSCKTVDKKEFEDDKNNQAQVFVKEKKLGTSIRQMTEEIEKANKQTVEVVIDVLDNKEVQKVSTYFSSSYVEHGIENDFDREELLKYLKRTEGACLKRNVYYIIADGDFVAVLSKMNFDSKIYLVGDIFRLEEQKIVERWTLNQEINSKNKIATNNQKDYLSFNTQDSWREDLKKKTNLLFEKTFMSANTKVFSTLLSNDFVQYSHDIPLGKQGFIDMLSIGPIEQNIKMILGEGNIVFVYSIDSYYERAIINVLRYTDEQMLLEYWTVRGEPVWIY